MNDALTATHRYLMSHEGTCGFLTIIVLALACVVTLTCLTSYPEASKAFAFMG
jgi:hypothetical protein